MPATALALGTLALALAWPLPILLSRARWPARSPGLALVLWQSIALTGGLSMIGALFAYGLLGFGTSSLPGIRSLSDHAGFGVVPTGTTFDQVLALAAAILLAGHLLLNLAATFLHARVQLLRHRHLVALLSEPSADRPGTRVIDHEAPVAYCLPGATSATVLSRGLISLLDADQLRAVVAHERAHLLQRHHVVLLAFRSWRSALPWFPIATRAETAVGLLVEMLADDQARRQVDDRTLAMAIVLVGSAHGPVSGASESGASTTGASATGTSATGTSASGASATGTSATGASASGAQETDAAALAGPDHPLDLLTPRLRRLMVATPRLSRHQGFGVLAASAGLLALPALLLLLG